MSKYDLYRPQLLVKAQPRQRSAYYRSAGSILRPDVPVGVLATQSQSDVAQPAQTPTNILQKNHSLRYQKQLEHLAPVLAAGSAAIVTNTKVVHDWLHWLPKKYTAAKGLQPDLSGRIFTFFKVAGPVLGLAAIVVFLSQPNPTPGTYTVTGNHSFPKKHTSQPTSQNSGSTPTTSSATSTPQVLSATPAASRRSSSPVTDTDESSSAAPATPVDTSTLPVDTTPPADTTVPPVTDPTPPVTGGQGGGDGTDPGTMLDPVTGLVDTTTDTVDQTIPNL